MTQLFVPHDEAPAEGLIHEGRCGPYDVRLYEHSLWFRQNADGARSPWFERPVNEYGTSFGDFVRAALSDDMLRYGYQSSDQAGDVLCIYDHGKPSQEAIETGEGRAGDNFGYVVNVGIPVYDEWSYQSQWPLLGESRQDMVNRYTSFLDSFARDFGGSVFVIDARPTILVDDSGEQ